MMVHDLPIRPEWVLDDRDPKTGLDVPIAFPENGPTAYVVNCDCQAARAVRELQEKGIRVPEDVSIVGFDDYIYPGLCDKGITTYSANVQEMTDDGFTGTVAELVMPGLFELGAELNVVFEEDAWYEKTDGTSGTVAQQRPDFSGCYVLVICTEYDQAAAAITVNTIWQVQPPEHTPQKG